MSLVSFDHFEKGLSFSLACVDLSPYSVGTFLNGRLCDFKIYTLQIPQSFASMRRIGLMWVFKAAWPVARGTWISDLNDSKETYLCVCVCVCVCMQMSECVHVTVMCVRVDIMRGRELFLGMLERLDVQYRSKVWVLYDFFIINTFTPQGCI